MIWQIFSPIVINGPQWTPRSQNLVDRTESNLERRRGHSAFLSMLHVNVLVVLHLRCFIFKAEHAKGDCDRKMRSNFGAFDSLWKLGEWWTRCLNESNKFNLGYKLSYTFAGHRCADWGLNVWRWKQEQSETSYLRQGESAKLWKSVLCWRTLQKLSGSGSGRGWLPKFNQFFIVHRMMHMW